MSLRSIPRRLWPATYDGWKTTDPRDTEPEAPRSLPRTDTRPIDEQLAELNDGSHWEDWDAFFARIEAKK